MNSMPRSKTLFFLLPPPSSASPLKCAAVIYTKLCFSGFLLQDRLLDPSTEKCRCEKGPDGNGLAHAALLWARAEKGTGGNKSLHRSGLFSRKWAASIFLPFLAQRWRWGCRCNGSGSVPTVHILIVIGYYFDPSYGQSSVKLLR